ncbi:MAG: hypothetical protein H6712_28110 [Myxococcales bacterium]|nr:hypothetical protein [Myxococcales bacterium]
MARAVALALAWAPACTVADPLPGFGGGGGSVGVTLGPASEDSGDGSDTGGDETDDGSGTGDDDGTGIEPPACSAPDLLVVLDRTGTMYLDPAGNVPAAVEQSRWAIAVGALEQVVQALDGEGTPLDQTVRFGLELFPQHHPDCSTVEESIAGVFPLNPTCQGPELLVEPALGTGASVAGQIDASTGELCESTPLRLAIEGAGWRLSPAPTTSSSSCWSPTASTPTRSARASPSTATPTRWSRCSSSRPRAWAPSSSAWAPASAPPAACTRR